MGEGTRDKRRLIIGMVWYTSARYREKIRECWSERFYFPEYIPEREKLLACQLDGFDFEFWYYQPTDTEIKLESKNVLYEQYDNPDIKSARHYNSQTGILQLAILAEQKKADFVYIEQDCLVFGLKNAINNSIDDNIRFGGNDWSLHSNWAEQSFLYVNNNYLDSFINKTFYAKLWKSGAPEPKFNQLFIKDCHYWEFGFGRKRPIDFNNNIYYAQQLTDIEYNKFKKTIEAEYGN